MTREIKITNTMLITGGNRGLGAVITECFDAVSISRQAGFDITKDIDATAMATMLLAIPTGLSLLSLAGVPRVPESKWESIYLRFYQAVKN